MNIISTSGSSPLPEGYDYISFFYTLGCFYFMTFLSGIAMSIIIAIPLIIISFINVNSTMKNKAAEGKCERVRKAPQEAS